MEPIVSSETSEIRTQTPGNYPKRNNLQRNCHETSDFCSNNNPVSFVKILHVDATMLQIQFY